MPDASHYDPGIDLEAMQNLPNYYGAMFDCFRPYVKGRGVEFGAGWGTVSARLEPLLDQLELVEPAENLAQLLEDRFSDNAAVSVIADTLEGSAAAFPEASRDTIILINVLEHIEDDDRALKELLSMLRPGGHLLLFVPALPFLFSALDTALGHYRRYTLKGLRRQARAVGFSITAARYFDFIGVFPWLLINTWGGRKNLNSGMVQIYDSFIFPLTGFLEKRLPMPFGKNIIMVAQRPGGPKD